jgi:glycosyltransferase involved in cell wall biosynthesis
MQVSVIIPTYNSARYLVEAVDSVLAQTVTDLEILVIDDGSTDQTEAVMRKHDPRLRYIRQNNSGVAVARNRGIQESRGTYVAFLDADDTWYSQKLERQLSELGKNPGLRACYSAFCVADSNLVPLEVRRNERKGSALEDLLLRGNIIGTPSTVVCERALFGEVGGFDPALSQCADWEMWVRLAAVTEFLFIDEPLITYRQHDGNMSRNAPLLERDSVLVLEKGFTLPGISASLLVRRRAAFARNYMVLAGTYLNAWQVFDFARCAIRAVALDYHQIGYLMAFPLRAAIRMRSNAETA